MTSRSLSLALALGFALPVIAHAREDVALESATRITADAPEWRELVAAFARAPDVKAEFTERRYFPFSREPVVLRGEARVSRQRGLSLRYTAPDERLVIVDTEGVLMRPSMGGAAPPPQATKGIAALLHILRFDLAALEKEFDVHGRRAGDAWAIVLVPRDADVRRAIGNIHVGGERATVRTVELRRSAKQHIDITLHDLKSPAVFSTDEVKKYFR